MTQIFASQSVSGRYTFCLLLLQELSDQCFDAFAVVFSITDRSSYQTAVDQLYNLRYEQAVNNKPTILIANKIDLVRKRKVAKEGEIKFCCNTTLKNKFQQCAEVQQITFYSLLMLINVRR